MCAASCRKKHRSRDLRLWTSVAFLVATGTTPAAHTLAAEIVAVGGLSVGERLAEARARRLR